MKDIERPLAPPAQDAEKEERLLKYARFSEHCGSFHMTAETASLVLSVLAAHATRLRELEAILRKAAEFVANVEIGGQSAGGHNFWLANQNALSDELNACLSNAPQAAESRALRP